jgi:glyoxylase-like metal-dependent hydrolase (beta-lactamase superfamily II)
MSFPEKLGNVYMIDANMFNFARYHSIFLVKGKKLALIDTGLANQFEVVRAGIKAHGFSLSDISYIFVTHSHPDHCGGAAPLLRESPKAKVYVHPAGAEHLIDPTTELVNQRGIIPPEMQARFGTAEPVPPSRLEYLKDGDVFDLGNGEKLRIIYAPGHQPDGVVIWEEKNKGLFINDLVGNCFPDADAHYPLNPPGSDHRQGIKSLQKLMDLPVAYLFLGHYGISDKPQQVMTRSIEKMQQLLDIGVKYMKQGKPEMIAGAVYEVILPELEKLGRARGEEIFRYATQEHIAAQVKLFAKYCQEKLKI